MKIAFYCHVLVCSALLIASGCVKEPEKPTVTIDIKVPNSRFSLDEYHLAIPISQA